MNRNAGSARVAVTTVMYVLPDAMSGSLSTNAALEAAMEAKGGAPVCRETAAQN